MKSTIPYETYISILKLRFSTSLGSPAIVGHGMRCAWERSTEQRFLGPIPGKVLTSRGDITWILTTVDGRNPAPLHRYYIPLFTRFYTSQVVSRISEPSTVGIKKYHNNEIYIHIYIYMCLQLTSKSLSYPSGNLLVAVFFAKNLPN